MSGAGATLTGSATGSGTDTFRLAGSADNSFNVSQIGAGWTLLDKTGTSNWTLTGTSTYAGPVTVNGGTLSVNGNLVLGGSLTVNAGGTLGGTGTVGNTTINGGTLAPGNSIGTLTVSGNLIVHRGLDLSGRDLAGNADRTNVTGTATLGGATVKANFATGSLCREALHHPQRDRRRQRHVRRRWSTPICRRLHVEPELRRQQCLSRSRARLRRRRQLGSGLNGNQQNVANALIELLQHRRRHSAGVRLR